MGAVVTPPHEIVEEHPGLEAMADEIPHGKRVGQGAVDGNPLCARLSSMTFRRLVIMRRSKPTKTCPTVLGLQLFTCCGALFPLGISVVRQMTSDAGVVSKRVV